MYAFPSIFDSKSCGMMNCYINRPLVEERDAHLGVFLLVNIAYVYIFSTFLLLVYNMTRTGTITTVDQSRLFADGI